MKLQRPQGPRLFTPPPETRLHALAGVRMASFSRRAAALFLDFLIAAAIFVAGAIPLGRYLQRTGRLADGAKIELNFFHNWYSVVWLVAYYGLSLYFGQGRTLGKRLLRLRVVSLVHEHISLWTAVERALGYGASALEAGFGFLQYFLHPNQQTVHDRIAETIVIDERPLT